MRVVHKTGLILALLMPSGKMHLIYNSNLRRWQFFSLAVLTFPEFHLDANSKSEIPILKIEFGTNDKDKVFLAQHRFANRKYDPNVQASCLFEGVLRHDSKTRVIVTGCPDSRFEVIFSRFKKL